MARLLLCIDFEKAFDSLDWTFMHKVLKAFGFQKDIRRWISVFYNNIKSTVLVNGQPSPWFSIKRGCRQGDPISPYLFILCAEILAIMIKENRDIKGKYHSLPTILNYFKKERVKHSKKRFGNDFGNKSRLKISIE